MGITTAIAKTQEAHAERCNVSVDILTDELEAARRMAEKNYQASAMVSATMSKAKLHGLLDVAQKPSSGTYLEVLDTVKKNTILLCGKS